MVQIYERCKPLHLTSPINIDHAMFIWRDKPDLSFSKKLSRNQNITYTLAFKCYCLTKFVYVYQVTPSLNGLESFFNKKECFFVKLMIIMFIGMFNIQYW